MCPRAPSNRDIAACGAHHRASGKVNGSRWSNLHTSSPSKRIPIDLAKQHLKPRDSLSSLAILVQSVPWSTRLAPAPAIRGRLFSPSRFNTLNRATGNRLKRQMVDSVTGVVENEEMIKGYAIAKDQYVTVEDEELSEIAIESSHTVDIENLCQKRRSMTASETPPTTWRRKTRSDRKPSR